MCCVDSEVVLETGDGVVVVVLLMGCGEKSE